MNYRKSTNFVQAFNKKTPSIFGGVY